jgi:hypothetical protein
MLEASLVIALLILGATFGGLLVYAWQSDKRPLRDQFNEMHHAADSLEQRARRVQ